MVDTEGMKFVLIMLGIILIPMIGSFLYIYKITDVYYKIKKFVEDKIENHALRKIILISVYAGIILLGRALINLFFGYIINTF